MGMKFFRVKVRLTFAVALFFRKEIVAVTMQYAVYIYYNCIVLYLYIYKALLAAHTNQKRLQCARPREKRAVLREQKETQCFFSGAIGAF